MTEEIFNNFSGNSWLVVDEKGLGNLTENLSVNIFENTGK